jgi:hypothetical protein
MAKVQMRMGNKPIQDKKESFLKEKMKDKGIDVAIDSIAGKAQLSIPLEMLELLIDVFKKIEKSMSSEQEQQQRRTR